MNSGYKKTITACFAGYIVQAIVNNFVPLLFLTFQGSYGIPLSKITLLITVNFAVQLTVDLISVKLVDKIGYRISALSAHIFAAAGFILLTVLPEIMDPFTGIMLAVVVYAIGGGLLEVIISPIVEACPTDNKEKAMSLLHSFYCWGQVAVVLLSTLFFTFCGIANWRIASWFWAIIPIANAIVFLKVPIASIVPEGEKQLSLKELAKKSIFWVLMLVMLCAGACELSVSQWASAFAERGLGVSKTMGDLLGPMAFAVLMGIARAFYGKYGDRINLQHFMLMSGGLCVISYLLISLVPGAVTGLIGCAVCGLSVGILWPGTFSTASAAIRGGGTAMFALFALAGDVGCSLGPTVVGLVSGSFGDNLHLGILAAAVFPVLLIFGLLAAKKLRSSKN